MEKETRVFGENVKNNYYHNSGNVIWGVVLILAGIVFLGIQSGLLPVLIWEIILRYWAVILILWGIQIMLPANPASTLIMGLLSLVVFGSIVVIGIQETNPALIYQLGLDKLPWYNWLNYIQLR